MARLEEKMYIESVVGLHSRQCYGTRRRKCQLMMQQQRVLSWIRVAEHVGTPRSRLAAYVVGQEVFAVKLAILNGANKVGMLLLQTRTLDAANVDVFVVDANKVVAQVIDHKVLVLLGIDHFDEHGGSGALHVHRVPLVVVEQILVAHIDDLVVVVLAIVHALYAAVLERQDQTGLIDKLFERKEQTVA